MPRLLNQEFIELFFDYLPHEEARPWATSFKTPPSDADRYEWAGRPVTGTGTGKAWRSGVLERSPDGGMTWATVGYLPTYVVLGDADTVLPAPATHIGAANIDKVSTVEVTVLRGSLESVTDAQLLAGANYAMLGEELIQFGQAELIGPRRYRLSYLLRGRRGTEWAMSTHGASEPFTLLAGTVFVPASAASVGMMGLYRLTAPGAPDSAQTTFAPSWSSVRPWAPDHIRGVRVGDDLTVSWIRRSRIGTELPDQGEIPLDEPTEVYRVEVLDGELVVRSTDVTSPSWTYPAADQTTDFGAPQPAVAVRVAQISNVAGPGYPATAIV